MANIPKLKDNVSAQATTGTVDRSGVLKEEQRGIAEFGTFLQKTIDQGSKIYDSKVYASDSTKGQEELLGFMSDTKNEKIKNDYYKQNKGNMAGYATFRAKKNMEIMERRLSGISHPKARKELEKQMSYQAGKSLLSDMGDENRIVQGLVQEREVLKNQVLANQISTMKLPSQNLEYDIALATRLGDIEEGTKDGTIDPVKAQKMKVSIIDDSHNMRVRALVEGGNSKDALKFVRENVFGTTSQQKRSRDYIMSKSLDGKKKGYDYLKLQNDLAREQKEASINSFDVESQKISNSNLGPAEKASAYAALSSKYQKEGAFTGKHAKLLRNANYENSRGAVSSVLTSVQLIPPGETNTAVFKGAVGSLRAIAVNNKYPAKVRKEATNALNKVLKKQALHEKLVEQKAYGEVGLHKSKYQHQKKTHNKIINKIQEDYDKDLPVEAEVELYKLYAEGKEKRFIEISELESFKTPGDEPFVVSVEKAVNAFKKNPEGFDNAIRKSIKRRRASLSSSGVEGKFRDFKKSFDSYMDRVDNFKTHEKAILDKYSSKGLK